MDCSSIILTCDFKIEKTQQQKEFMTQSIDELLEIYKDETKRKNAVELIKMLLVHKSNCESFIKEYEIIREEALDIETQIAKINDL